jgi:hypothetical protein
MFPRPTDRVRLCLTGIADSELPDYLSTIGWPGSPARLARLLARIASRRRGTSHAGVGLLHLDVGDGVAGRLGLEYYFDRQPQLGGRVAEEAFLHDLKQMELCTADKIRGLQQWPGYGFEPLPHEVWPSLVVRRVNHVKLVYEPGRPMAAKAYLYLSHRFHNAAAGSPERQDS